MHDHPLTFLVQLITNQISYKLSDGILSIKAFFAFFQLKESQLIIVKTRNQPNPGELGTVHLDPSIIYYHHY